jgi:hypothetical protein
MKKILFLAITLFYTVLSHATHNMAGRIGYTNLSGYTYQITVETFTNTTNTNADRCELILYFGNGDSAAIPRINGPSLLCPSTHDGIMMNGCVNGMRYNVYQTTVTYSSPGNYTLSIVDYNRSAGILNIANSVNTPFTLSAELVISPFLAPNNSPSYANIPVICSQVNSTYNYNPGLVDSDGDSLYYENILRGTGGYSDPSTSNAFYIDSLTGDVIWNQPNMTGNYVYDIKISEWRKLGPNYYFIGSSTMEVWNRISALVGINEEKAEEFSLKAFPNPSTGSVNFDFTGVSQGDLIISNSLGQRIQMTRYENRIISLHDLSPGIYFYQFISPGKVNASGKFVILEGSLK